MTAVVDVARLPGMYARRNAFTTASPSPSASPDVQRKRSLSSGHVDVLSLATALQDMPVMGGAAAATVTATSSNAALSICTPKRTHRNKRVQKYRHKRDQSIDIAAIVATAGSVSILPALQLSKVPSSQDLLEQHHQLASDESAATAKDNASGAKKTVPASARPSKSPTSGITSILGLITGSRKKNSSSCKTKATGSDDHPSHSPQNACSTPSQCSGESDDALQFFQRRNSVTQESHHPASSGCWDDTFVGGGGGGDGSSDHAGASSTLLSRKSSSKIRTKELCDEVLRLRNEVFQVMKRMETMEMREQRQAQKKDSLWIDTRPHSVTMLDKIGGGGSGTTKVHRFKVDGMVCAGKTMNRNLSTNYERQSFMRETEILHNLPQHSNVVRYLFHRIERESITMFMALYDGSLEDLIAHHKRHGIQMNVATIAHIALLVACGVRFLHQNNVLHRDLKSGNVFLTFSKPLSHDKPAAFVISEVVVGDFDVSAVKYSTLFRRRSESESIDASPPFVEYDAEDEYECVNTPHSSRGDSCDNDAATAAAAAAAVLQQQQQQKCVVAADDEYGTYGTHGFIAPEILDMDESVSPRRYTTKVDVYAFGMLLYEMMTLEMPYHDRNYFDVTAAILHGEMPTIPFAAYQKYGMFQELFRECVRRDPAKRISLVDALLSLKRIYSIATGLAEADSR